MKIERVLHVSEVERSKVRTGEHPRASIADNEDSTLAVA